MGKVITALVAEKHNADIFHEVAFDADKISLLMAVGENSAIVLDSNVTIPVAMPLDNLRTLTGGYGGNLTDVTGPVAKNIKVPELTDAFNTKAKLTILAIVRKPGSDETAVIEFQEADIASVVSEQVKRAASGESVKIVFNGAAFAIDPFGAGAVALDMPYKDFRQQVVDANAAAAEKLDLAALFVTNSTKYGARKLV